MKKLLLTFVVVAATAVTMYGQGRVSFNNSASGNVITIAASGGAPGQGAPGAVLGSNYSIQLLWAPQGIYATEAAFLAALVGSGPAVAFLGTTGDAGSSAGLFAGGATPSPAGTTMPVAPYTMQARAWFNGGVNATFAAAAAGVNNIGYSGFFNLTPTASPTPAPVTLGLQSFPVGIVPEPSTFALAGLGAAALLLFRRRK